MKKSIFLTTILFFVSSFTLASTNSNTSLKDYLDKKDLENENRLENIKELLSAMKDFDNLEGFLEHVALATSVDQDWDGEKVNMMTMHGSKGLEFDVVFLPGWEEGLFPHQKSIEEKGQNGLEEERRLAYVGITRAKKKALISFAMNRFYQGNWIDSMASRFIEELPEKFLEKNGISNINRNLLSGGIFTIFFSIISPSST
jgi:DNA helicase-2/ATP-dependent DNA helicase PcrA